MLQQLLFDPAMSYRRSLSDAQAMLYKSDLGMTEGTLAPSEYNAFWLNVLDTNGPNALTDEEIINVNKHKMTGGVSAYVDVFQKPVVMKAMPLVCNLEILLGAFPQAIIIHVQRNPLYVGSSILKARKAFWGTDTEWISVRPKEYEQLVKLPVYDQIAGQIFYIERRIQEGLEESTSEHKIITIDYEDFCKAPRKLFTKVKRAMTKLNCFPSNKFPSRMKEITFTPSIRKHINEKHLTGLEKEYRRLIFE